MIKLSFKPKLAPKHFDRTLLDLSDRKRPRPVFLAIILVASLLLIASVADYFNTSRQLARLTNADDEFIPDQLQKPAVKFSDGEISAVQTAVNQLAIPWGTLFSAMEKVATENVVLISLEPDATKRRVRIIAEAPDVYQMLDYLRAFSAQPSIHKVTLVNQKMGEDTQESAVRFTLEAYWAG